MKDNYQSMSLEYQQLVTSYMELQSQKEQLERENMVLKEQIMAAGHEVRLWESNLAQLTTFSMMSAYKNGGKNSGPLCEANGRVSTLLRSYHQANNLILTWKMTISKR